MVIDTWGIGFNASGRLIVYMPCNQSVGTYDIDFVHVDIFNLLIKVYLSLIFIKYFINESNIWLMNLE
jgi:hypothetical protein